VCFGSIQLGLAQTHRSISRGIYLVVANLSVEALTTMSSHVPKFASFRPKPKPVPEPPKEPQNHEKIEKLRKEKERSGRRSPSPKRNAVDKNAASNKVYFSDRRGDADVVRYGTLSRYDIPPYRRYGHGFVLGLSRDQQIDRDNSTDKAICTTPATRRRQERLLTDKRANRSSGRALRLVKTNDASRDLDQDFMLLSANTKPKRDDSEDEESRTPDAHYRGIEGPKSNEPTDPDTHYESDTELVLDTGTMRQNSELVRRTKEHPEDLQGWLALIDHQEAMLKLERPSAELITSDKAHLADIRITTYEEALKKVGKDQASQLQLYKGLLNEARRAWHGVKLNNKWKDVLAKHPHSIDLWMMYLDFVQSRFTSFKYEECRAIFFKCLDALHTSKDDISPSTTLHIILRLTSMTHEAGYQELALAAWQALLEYHCRPEHHYSLPEADTMQAFEEFWESEIPRIGEPEAKGWTYNSATDAPPSGPSRLLEKETSDTVFEDFRKRELDATTKLRYPGRTSDDVGEDDAFHTIFFSDVEPYLKALPARVPSVLIIDAFLCFCGLPPLLYHGASLQEWWSGPFLQRHWKSTSPESKETTQFTQTLSRFLDCPSKRFQMTTELLFQQDFSPSGIGLTPKFIRLLLRLLASDPSHDNALDEYILAYERQHFPSDAFKFAKATLRARPASLRLYNAYGLVESHLGNSAKADHVFSMALSMQKVDTVLSTLASLKLFSNWVSAALNRGEQTEALMRLVSPLGKLPVEVTPTLISNARTTFNSITEGALLAPPASPDANWHALQVQSQNYESAILCSSLSALLAYLSSNHNASRALEIHQNLTAWFISHKLSASPAAELHAQSIAQFLTYHITHAPIVKPVLIRSTLEPLIASFPDNTILLSVYAANESRFSIDDRVRGIMHQTSLHGAEERSVSGWAFAIHYETLKSEHSGSTSHSIRALYKRATDSDSTGAHCPALWKAYVDFELEQLRKEQRREGGSRRPRRDGKKGQWEARIEEAEQRVKDTFLLGLKNLPWCKEYIMLAFGEEAKEVFSEEELWKVYRVILEKECRVYVELDDMHMET
jgi:hypothetical protein